MRVTDRQIKAARALLGIDGKTLAEMSGVSLVTVRRIEADPDAAGYARQTLISTLEKAGCDFIEDRGVVLRRAPWTGE
jgi:transcriptional regulator with XRE-family HTH domain